MQSHLTQYQLYDLIENANLDLNYITDNMRYLIGHAAKPEQWICATEMFLRGIDARHNIPAKTIYSLQDICYSYKETHKLTTSQQLFISNSLIDQWDQLGVEMRATILT